MSQILGVKFSDYGPMCYFASGPLVVRVGLFVLVETDQGLALGRIATACDPAAAAQETAEGRGAPEDDPAPFGMCMELPAWDGAETTAPVAATEEPGEESASSDSEVAGKETPAASLFSSDQSGQLQPKPQSDVGLQRIYRVATEEDLAEHAENRELTRQAFLFCRRAISELGLEMKLVDVEMLHDRSKMIFFFTAPNRIDFRELIKSLVREFHTRIELRQIGVRHETQMIGALGNCGQICCCRRFLRKFAPVTIKMAKEQNLFLNPAKISGICGRLLCCLSYEQKGYEEFRKECPKIGKRVQTPLGSAKVLRANFFKKTISVWLEDIGEREYTLDEWKEFMNRAPEEARAIEAAEQQSQAVARPGRMRGSRLSAGRQSRTERGAHSGKTERPVRTDRPGKPEKGAKTERPKPERPGKAERQELGETQNPGAGSAGEAIAEEAAASGTEHRKPRRRRRKSKGQQAG